MKAHTQATVRATTRPSVGKIDFRIFSRRFSQRVAVDDDGHIENLFEVGA
jgi:hypothetical protein